MLKLLTAARRVSVPIVVIRTADQFATAVYVSKVALANSSAPPIVQWDPVRGMHPFGSFGETDDGVNKAAKTALANLKIVPEDTIDFASAMKAAALLPQGTAVIVHNAHRQLTSSEPLAVAQNVQAVANLRDLFKQNWRMLILLGPAFQLPSELAQDVMVLDHPLPTPEELGTIVDEIETAARKGKPTLKPITPEVRAKAVEALSGLSAFAADQVTATSYVGDALDLDALWEQKRITIEQTRGLRVWRGKEKFDDLVGLESIKANLRDRIKARTPVGVVVFIDEIDKVLANVESDTSGVRMDQFRTLLTEMEDNGWTGLVGVGVPGSGKSALAKAFGNEAGVPTIALDLGDMEDKFVGESQGLIRQAVAVIKAVGQGKAYFIATSNNATVMRPELQRRFTDGMFFFDVMTKEQRADAWRFYMTKYDLPAQPLPDDDGWTGAEVRNCCRRAWDVRGTLLESAKFIVPMARSRGPEIEALRQYAHGKFLDANRDGSYAYEIEPMRRQMRAIVLDPTVVQEIQKMKES